MYTCSFEHNNTWTIYRMQIKTTGRVLKFFVSLLCLFPPVFLGRVVFVFEISKLF